MLKNIVFLFPKCINIGGNNVVVISLYYKPVFLTFNFYISLSKCIYQVNIFFCVSMSASIFRKQINLKHFLLENILMKLLIRLSTFKNVFGDPIFKINKINQTF